MVWKFLIVAEFAYFLSLIFLMLGSFTAYKHMKEDPGPCWNLFLIGVSLLALRFIGVFVNNIYPNEGILLGMSILGLLSDLSFAAALMISHKQDHRLGERI